MTVRNLGDIEALEAQPFSSHRLPQTSYEVLAATAARTPKAKALSFFLRAEAYAKAFEWTYAELLADVTRAANLFHALGVTAQNPAAFVLPNLPETHFVIWGGETAGAVLAINPYFEPAQIANLMKTARASVLVTLAPNPAVDLWTRLAPFLGALPDLKTVALVDAMSYTGARQDRATSRGSPSPASTSSIFAIACGLSQPTGCSRRWLAHRTRSHPTSAPAARQARRRSPCGRTQTKSSTPGVRRR